MDAMDKGQTAVVMKAAKAAGAITTVDIFAGSPKDLPAVAQVLPYTDYFMPSIEEAQALCGRSDHGDTAKFFLDMGVKACVLTLGGDGAYYHDNAGVKFRIPAFDIKVKCTCGCGDAFDAGYAVALVQGFDPETAVRFAQATSALNATGLHEDDEGQVAVFNSSRPPSGRCPAPPARRRPSPAPTAGDARSACRQPGCRWQ